MAYEVRDERLRSIRRPAQWRLGRLADRCPDIANWPALVIGHGTSDEGVLPDDRFDRVLGKKTKVRAIDLISNSSPNPRRAKLSPKILPPKVAARAGTGCSVRSEFLPGVWPARS